MNRIQFLKAALLILFFAEGMRALAQDSVNVFYSYRAYRDNSPNKSYSDYKGNSHVLGKMSIYVEKNGEVVKIPCSEFWGFTYKGFLFRTDPKAEQVAVLISQGKICYYENGQGMLSMLRDKTNIVEIHIGSSCYFSEDLDSEMASTPGPNTLAVTLKEIKRFWKDHPQYETLKKDIGRNYYDHNYVRAQVKKFEESK